MRRNKKTTIIAVLFILCVFPIITYFYLDSGLKFRLSIVGEIAPKDSIDNFIIYDSFNSSAIEFYDALPKKYALLIKGSSNKDTEIEESDDVYLMLEEFSDREELFILFQSATLKETNYFDVRELARRDAIGLYITDSPLALDIFPDSLKSAFAMALINDKAKVLNYYDMSDTSALNSIIEHLSVVLPNQPMFTRRYRGGK